MRLVPKVLVGYIIFIFVLQSAAVFFPHKVSGTYLSVAILAMGMAAIVCQKKFNHRKFVDMGFRLNRNALIGLSVGLVFTATVVILNWWLLLRLGLVELTVNEGSRAFRQGETPILAASRILVLGGAFSFLVCLFGEELAFRGYILPKLGEIFGGFKAVILCSAIFSLWHLPAYFSIYTGGAAEHGWGSVAQMLLAHGIGVIPVCILYMTTRELYGVSLYHGLINVIYYAIIGNPAFGEISKGAIYSMKILNEPAMEIVGWALTIVNILIMLALCALARKLVVRRDIPAATASGGLDVVTGVGPA